MSPKLFFRSNAVRIFLALFTTGLMWSLYTNHAWEDYYITYRASKNFATGHGLTFTQGERVHSFTSPLGVLLPSVANLLTASRSDYAALWIFRLWSIAAYAGAGILLWKLAIFQGFGRFASGLLLVLYAFDAKIVDFSTNGMETGFLLLFLCWALFAEITRPPRQGVHLGLAWAGLMWTRPDSFLYIGALLVGSFVFRLAPSRPIRIHFLNTHGVAAGIALAVYLPWILCAWLYYGTPVPHTIIAKGLFHPPTSLSSLASAAWHFPAKITAYRDILTTTFMPPYSYNTGWPALALSVSYWIAACCMVVWLIPGVRGPTRLASFAFLVGQFYLTTYVEFPVPWYIPTLTVFSFLVICGVINQLLSSSGVGVASRNFAFEQARSWLVRVPAVIFAFGTLTITVLAAHQLRLQETIIEHGERREIGRWLRAHATPKDSVFLEPLGYIGFYSNLKMLDYPGLSSPEVVAARRRASGHSYPDCWPELIMDLSPNWLVLRGYEAEAIRKQSPELLRDIYSLAKTFDVRGEVNAIPAVQGRGYLLNDALFEVYCLNSRATRDGHKIRKGAPIHVRSLRANHAWNGSAQDVGMKIFAHAPSRLQVDRPLTARWFSGSIEMEPGAYARPESATDGASFRISFIGNDGARSELFRRDLNPRDEVKDRSPYSFSLELPVNQPGMLELETTSGPTDSNAFDWTYWSMLRFEYPDDQ
jgi:hypothetical protein